MIRGCVEILEIALQFFLEVSLKFVGGAIEIHGKFVGGAIEIHWKFVGGAIEIHSKWSLYEELN